MVCGSLGIFPPPPAGVSKFKAGKGAYLAPPSLAWQAGGSARGVSDRFTLARAFAAPSQAGGKSGGRKVRFLRLRDFSKNRLAGRRFLCFVAHAAKQAAQKMTTQSKTTSGIVSDSNLVSYNPVRARARAAVNSMLGLVTAGEAGQKIALSSKVAEWSTGGHWRAFVDYRASGRAADVAEWAAESAEVEENKRAARDCAARAAARAAADKARAAGNGAAIARLRRLAECGGAGVDVGKGGVLVVAPSIGAAAMVAASCAAIGHGDAGRRAELVTAAAAAKRAIGKGWHTEQAKRAQVVYRGLQAQETQARAVALLRCGLLGRAAARGARIGFAMGRRWLRRNSRREALALVEVCGAAGVDDLGAGADWSGELQSIASGVHLRAAAYGAAMVAAPLPACSALVARGYSGGLSSSLRLAVLGRGRRVDGLPVVEWTDKGRQVAADSIGILGRGCVWIWAARQAGRDMHSARYGRGGRDGKEVAADWSIVGDMRAACAFEVELAQGVQGPVLPAALASVTSNPWHCAPSRRPSVVQAARDSLAADCRDLRAKLAAARAAAAAAPSRAAKVEAGAVVGGLLHSLSSACKRARALGRAMRGQVADCSDWITYAPSGRFILTPAGRKMAERLRDARELAAAASGAVKVARVALPARVLVGDELASGDSVAPSSLLQSGGAGAALAAALAARAVVEPITLADTAGGHLRAAMLARVVGAR